MQEPFTQISTRLIIDKADRVVIPKLLREKLHLEAGMPSKGECAGEQLTLVRARGSGPLTKEHGEWVSRVSLLHLDFHSRRNELSANDR